MYQPILSSHTKPIPLYIKAREFGFFKIKYSSNPFSTELSGHQFRKLGKKGFPSKYMWPVWETVDPAHGCLKFV